VIKRGRAVEEKRKTESEEEIISEDALKKAEKYIEEEEGPSRRLSGKTDLFVTAVAVGMSLFHLYSAAGIVMTQILRGIHVMFVLFLTFLVFPSMKGLKNRILWIDVLLSLLGIAVVAYMLVDFENFIYRSVVPTFWDQFFGIILILLVLEATRRTSGWIMPAIVIAFLVYAMVGQELPKPWTHRGYDIGRIVGHMYMTLEASSVFPLTSHPHLSSFSPFTELSWSSPEPENSSSISPLPPWAESRAARGEPLPSPLFFWAALPGAA